jgi:hypothetical protein
MDGASDESRAVIEIIIMSRSRTFPHSPIIYHLSSPALSPTSGDNNNDNNNNNGVVLKLLTYFPTNDADENVKAPQELPTKLATLLTM